MGLRFGKSEEVRCIVDVPIKGQHDEALCLAHKTTTYWVAAGAYLRDDGYVLRPSAESKSYYPLTAEQISAHQADGSLPAPLPAYTIGAAEVAWGYSLWIVILVTTAWSLVVVRIKARRRREYAAATVGTRVDPGPPELKTEIDRYVAAQVIPHLASGERVQHQAYALDRDVSSGGMLGALAATAYYAILTTEQLVLLRTRVGAFGPLQEHRAVERIPRSSIVAVGVEDDLITLVLADGVERLLHVKSARSLSNQMRFLHNVPRLLAGESALDPSLGPPGPPSFAPPPSDRPPPRQPAP